MANGTVSIRPLKCGEYLQCAQLKVKEDQKEFVKDNWHYILMALDHADCNPPAVPYGVWSENEMVGFMMAGFDPRPPWNGWKIFQLMIDEKHQHCRYGRQAMTEAISLFRQSPSIESVVLGYHKTNLAARKFYQSLGFVEEGETLPAHYYARLRLR